MVEGLWAVAFIAFSVGSLAPFLIRPILRRFKVVDVPNERSSHTAPALRGGGLAPLLAWNIAVLATLTLGFTDVEPLLFVLLASNLAALVGFADDIRGLRAGCRFILQLLLGAGTAAAISLSMALPFWWIIVGTLVMVGYINVANFIDGINGISGFHGAIAGAAFVVSGSLTGHSWLVVGGFALGGSFVAFLPWNLRRTPLFLGDVGSYFLGAAIACLALMALGSGVSPLLVVSPLAVMLADTVSTVIRRFIRGEGVLSAHRTHVYQRLTDTRISHLGVTLLVSSFSAVTALLGFITWSGVLPVALGWCLIAVVCGVYLLLPRWRGSQLPPSPRSPLSTSIAVTAAPAAPGVRRRWVIVGASGFVGSALCTHLRNRGIDVVEVSAPRLEYEVNQQDAQCIAATAARCSVAEELASVLAGADVVVNAAGLATPDAEMTRNLMGANAYLPAVIAAAARRAGAVRFVHVSSAAVQGRTAQLDETARVSPFSPYSRSKALGEHALLALASEARDARYGIVVLRATSVQGPKRPTTLRLRELAASRIASVAAPGNQPSAVSGLHGLVATIEEVGSTRDAVPGIVLQPWEGLSVTDVLVVAGDGKRPMVLPRWICRLVIGMGFAGGRIDPRFSGLARRLEMTWFGQRQVAGWASGKVRRDETWLRAVLGADGEQRE